ncbi:hypothetical protein QOT17_002933 [Balamuthia mandrillaris]
MEETRMPRVSVQPLATAEMNGRRVGGALSPTEERLVMRIKAEVLRDVKRWIELPEDKSKKGKGREDLKGSSEGEPSGEEALERLAEQLQISISRVRNDLLTLDKHLRLSYALASLEEALKAQEPEEPALLSPSSPNHRAHSRQPYDARGFPSPSSAPLASSKPVQRKQNRRSTSIVSYSSSAALSIDGSISLGWHPRVGLDVIEEQQPENKRFSSLPTMPSLVVDSPNAADNRKNSTNKAVHNGEGKKAEEKVGQTEPGEDVPEANNEGKERDMTIHLRSLEQQSQEQHEPSQDTHLSLSPLSRHRLTLFEEVATPKMQNELDMMRVNVGGINFETRTMTLRKHPTTKLAKLAATRNSCYNQQNGQEEFTLFFDRNTRAFEHILEWYRSDVLAAPPLMAAEVWQRELSFWEVPDAVATPSLQALLAAASPSNLASSPTPHHARRENPASELSSSSSSSSSSGSATTTPQKRRRSRTTSSVPLEAPPTSPSSPSSATSSFLPSRSASVGDTIDTNKDSQKEERLVILNSRKPRRRTVELATGLSQGKNLDFAALSFASQSPSLDHVRGRSRGLSESYASRREATINLQTKSFSSEITTLTSPFFLSEEVNKSNEPDHSKSSRSGRASSLEADSQLRSKEEAKDKRKDVEVTKEDENTALSLKDEPAPQKGIKLKRRGLTPSPPSSRARDSRKTESLPSSPLSAKRSSSHKRSSHTENGQRSTTSASSSSSGLVLSSMATALDGRGRSSHTSASRMHNSASANPPTPNTKEGDTIHQRKSRSHRHRSKSRERRKRLSLQVPDSELVRDKVGTNNKGSSTATSTPSLTSAREEKQRRRKSVGAPTKMQEVSGMEWEEKGRNKEREDPEERKEKQKSSKAKKKGEERSGRKEKRRSRVMQEGSPSRKPSDSGVSRRV